MKIRTDFVTNSSSSSFIMAFKDEDSIKYELLDGFEESEMDYFYTLYKDIMDANRLSEKEIVDIIKSEFGFGILYDKYNAMHPNGSFEWDDYDNWRKTEEAQQYLEENISDKLEDLKKRIGDSDVFVELEYSDHTLVGQVLEHEILPYHPNTVKRFSHH